MSISLVLTVVAGVTAGGGTRRCDAAGETAGALAGAETAGGGAEMVVAGPASGRGLPGPAPAAGRAAGEAGRKVAAACACAVPARIGRCKKKTNKPMVTFICSRRLRGTSTNRTLQKEDKQTNGHIYLRKTPDT